MNDLEKSKAELVVELDHLRYRVAALEAENAELNFLQERHTGEDSLYQKLFISIFQNATFGLALLNKTGQIVAINKKQCDFMGYPEEEILGMSFADLTYPEDLGEHQQLYDELLRGERESFSLDKRNIRKDGRVAWFRLGVSLVRDFQGDPRFATVIYADISDQKETEEALRQQYALLQKAEETQAIYFTQVKEEQKRLRAILDTVPDAILLLDSDYQVLLANAPGVQYLAVLAGSIIDGVVTRLGDRQLKELLTSPPVRGVWHEIVAGSRHYVAIVRPVKNGSDSERWVLVIHDATEEREMQRRAQQQDRLAVVGQLAAGIAHDFNNILSVITLDADLVLMTNPKENHKKWLDSILVQAKQASNMIQQILDFGRRTAMERRPLPLAPFLREQIKLMRRILPENITIQMAHDSVQSIILADPTRIQQVVMNLVVNARDAMPDGGSIRINLDNLDLVLPEDAPVNGMRTGSWVRIQIADTGTGIPEDVLPHIFDPFFTTKEVGMGSGLGLAQVQGLVKQHAGEVMVETTPEKGTTFSLYFPAHNSLRVTEPIAASPLLRSAGDNTILLVEDNEELREITAVGLRSLGYKLIEAASGLDALTILESQAADITLVLSDVVMPEMGGQALFYAMQEKGVNLPLILMTGHPLDNELEELRGRGLAGWIAKPLNLRQLSSILGLTLGVEPPAET